MFVPMMEGTPEPSVAFTFLCSSRKCRMPVAASNP